MTPTSTTLTKATKTAHPDPPPRATVAVNGKIRGNCRSQGRVGPSVIDIGELYAQTGMLVTTGFPSIASTGSTSRQHRR